MIDDEEDGKVLALWRAVIAMAFTDAQQAPSCTRDEARSWLLGKSRDFGEVCGLADLDPEYVERFARQKIEAFDAGNVKADKRKIPKEYEERRYLFRGASLTMNELVLHSRVSRTAINWRLAAGWTVEDAVTKPAFRRVKALSTTTSKSTPKTWYTPQARFLYPFEGESLSVKQLALRTGIAESAIRQRLKAGWTLDEAVTVPNDRGNSPHRRAKLTANASKTAETPINASN